jgi:hypothetical protein
LATSGDIYLATRWGLIIAMYTAAARQPTRKPDPRRQGVRSVVT